MGLFSDKILLVITRSHQKIIVKRSANCTNIFPLENKNDEKRSNFAMKRVLLGKKGLGPSIFLRWSMARCMLLTPVTSKAIRLYITQLQYDKNKATKLYFYGEAVPFYMKNPYMKA